VQSALAARKPWKLQHLPEQMEAIEPTVRAIMDDIVIRDDGAQFIDNFASWVKSLRERPRKENSRIFVQLAVLAGQFRDADCKSVAVSLAALARIGLPRLAARDEARKLHDRLGRNVVDHTRNL
jgi:hypothetical protein